MHLTFSHWLNYLVSNSHLEFHRVPTETVIIPQFAAGKQRSWGIFHSERWLTAIHGLTPPGCLSMQSDFGDHWVCIATWNVSYTLASHCYIAKKKSKALIEILVERDCHVISVVLVLPHENDRLFCHVGVSALAHRGSFPAGGVPQSHAFPLPSAFCCEHRGQSNLIAFGRWAWGRGALL